MDQEGSNMSRMAIVLSGVLLTSCGFIQRKGRWGADAYKMSFKSVGKAFVKNATDPRFWAPAAAGAAIFISGQDRKISDWASTQTPLYGSARNARLYSDEAGKVLEYEAYASVLITTSWSGDGWTYAANKVKGTSAMIVSEVGTRSMCGLGKKTFRRRRPNQTNLESMPSSHSSKAATRELLLRRNLEYSDLNPTFTKTANHLNTAFTATIMWARVEGKFHYMSDVLAGYALSQLVSGFIFDAIMTTEPNQTLSLSPNPDGGATAMFTQSF